MSSVEYLREFVNERLTAAAEEIFRGFEKAIIEYEEEIDRQRKLLDIVWKPERLHMIELPQQHVCKEEEVLADQQLCIQERNSSLDQEDPEPPQIKEEQEELCISQEEEQLELKQETETFMLTPTDEESDHSEDQTLYFNPDKSQSVAETELPPSMCISWLKDESDCENPEESESNSDHQLLSHNSHVAESQDQKGEPKKQNRSYSNNVNNSNLLKIHCNTHTGKQSFKCETCGKDFNYKSKLQRHMRVHAGEKPYSCKTCGKDFRLPGDLKVHVRTHTGEKPYLCKTCGNRFCDFSALKKHMRIHTGEKPYACKTCGKAFRQNSNLTVHMRTHTGEKPFPCKTCGKGYGRNRGLLLHMIRAHAGEKPYLCKICGERFFGVLEFKRHIGVHTDNSFSI
ncbi:zinc finger protein 699-like isoform X2 [Sebastes umbrosus]|uniref:zinc finger protein 699-like isoform X2 n=1 Tax=Sebastes umbrosus TaxID=72105 RepID=UPI00189DB733|nr:zinc finger protein 699-like isoform X2 [Sebastes umbrosus]